MAPHLKRRRPRYVALGSVLLLISGALVWWQTSTTVGPQQVALPPLNTVDLNPDVRDYTPCRETADCPVGLECFARACRRPEGSSQPYGPCAFNRTCPSDQACKERRCQPLRRWRSKPSAGSAIWPQFRGPRRDALSEETGLLRRWPKDGPPLLWQAKALGRGFGHPAVTERTIFITGLLGQDGILTALDLNGRVQWQVSYGQEWRRGGPAGARQTPTVAHDTVIVASGLGVLSAHDASTGANRWSFPLYAPGDVAVMPNGYADAPLVREQVVYVLVGSGQRLALAIDSRTGKELWHTPGGPLRHAYGSLTAVDQGDRTLLLGMVQQGMVALDAADGRLLWVDDIPELAFDYVVTGHDRTFASPLLHRNGLVVRTLQDYERGLTIGARQVTLGDDDSPPEVVWQQPEFGVHYGGALLQDDLIYGVASNDRNSSPGAEPAEFSTRLMAVEWSSGRIVETLSFEGFGKAALIGADGLLFAQSELGHVVLVDTRTTPLSVTGTFTLPRVTSQIITYPALADGVLYVRQQHTLNAYDVGNPLP